MRMAKMSRAPLSPRPTPPTNLPFHRRGGRIRHGIGGDDPDAVRRPLNRAVGVDPLRVQIVEPRIVAAVEPRHDRASRAVRVHVRLGLEAGRVAEDEAVDRPPVAGAPVSVTRQVHVEVAVARVLPRHELSAAADGERRRAAGRGRVGGGCGTGDHGVNGGEDDQRENGTHRGHGRLLVLETLTKARRGLCAASTAARDLRASRFPIGRFVRPRDSLFDALERVERAHFGLPQVRRAPAGIGHDPTAAWAPRGGRPRCGMTRIEVIGRFRPLHHRSRRG
jgi:hypothetical protein